MLLVMTDSAREARARRLARRLGLHVVKGPDNYGNHGYFVATSSNGLVSGEFAMDIDELEQFLNED